MKPSKPDDVLAEEARMMGRPCELVASYVFEDRGADPLTFVVYDVKPDVLDDERVFRQRRWAVYTPEAGQTTRTSGILSTAIERRPASA